MKSCHQILAFGIAALLPGVVSGATLTWDTASGTAGAQGGSGTWLAASRWLQGSTNVTWISGSDAVFGGTAGTVTLTADSAVGNIAFNSGYTLVANDTSELELSSTESTTITVASGVTATIGLQMEYAGNAQVIEKEGTGTLVLSDLLDGGAANTEPTLRVRVGTVRLDAGFSTRGTLSTFPGATLNVNGTVSAGSLGGSGNVVLNGQLQLPIGDAFDNTLSGNITGTGSLLFGSNGGGINLTLTGNNTLADVHVRGGRLLLGSANAIAVNADVVLDGGEISLEGIDRSIASLSGTDAALIEPRFALGSANLTVGSSGTSTTYEGFFTGTGTLRKAGTGRLLLSSVSNSNNLFTGLVRVEAGTIAVPAVADSGAASPLGSGTTVELGTGASVGELEFTGTGPDSSNRSIVLIGPGGGAIDVFNATGNLTWSGVISGSGGFRKRGAGELTLTGANSLTGAVDVTAGRLSLGSAAALSTAGIVTLTNSAGAELGLDVNSTIRGLSGGGTTGGNVVLLTRTLTIDQDTNTTFAGVISGTSTAGLGAINKTGTGTLTLTGANTFTQDLRIQEGVLSVATIGATNTANPLGQGPVQLVGSSRVDLQACKLEYSIVSPK